LLVSLIRFPVLFARAIHPYPLGFLQRIQARALLWTSPPYGFQTTARAALAVTCAGHILSCIDHVCLALCIARTY